MAPTLFLTNWLTNPPAQFSPDYTDGVTFNEAPPTREPPPTGGTWIRSTMIDLQGSKAPEVKLFGHPLGTQLDRTDGPVVD